MGKPELQAAISTLESVLARDCKTTGVSARLLVEAGYGFCYDVRIFSDGSTRPLTVDAERNRMRRAKRNLLQEALDMARQTLTPAELDAACQEALKVERSVTTETTEKHEDGS